MKLTKIKADRQYLFDPAAHIIMRVVIAGSPMIAELKRAIVTSVREYDILNCRLLMDSKGDCYYVPMENDVIPDIEVYYNKVNIQELANKQYKKEFNLQKGELVRFVIVQSMEETEMYVIQHHLGGDGKSMLFLIEKIMTNLHMCPPFEVVNRERCVKVMDKEYASRYVEMNELISATIDEMNSKWRKENIVFDYSKRTEIFEDFWKDKDVDVNSIELNKDALSKLLEQCKHYGVTLNNVIYTIIIKAQKEINKTGIVVDVREKDNKDMGNFVEFVPMEESYNEEISFWENVIYMDSIMKNQIRDRKKLLLSALVRNNIDNGLADAFFFPDCKCKVSNDYNEAFFVGRDGLPILLSNIGVAPIKKNYGAYQIEKITFMSPLTLKTWCNIAVITINDTLILNMLTMKNDVRFKGLCDRMRIEFNKLVGNTIQQDSEARMKMVDEQFCVVSTL